LYSFQVVSGATRFPMNSGAMEEAIIVGISYEEGSRGPSSRIKDYTPIKANNWRYETGNAPKFTKFVEQQIIPFIEKNYQVKPNSRTFIGNSLGGLLGAYILFNNPDLFNNYILGSPSVWFEKDFILSSPMKKPSNPIKVYLSVGSLETPKFGQNHNMVKGAKSLADKIESNKSAGIELKYSVTEGATHATAFPTTVIQGLDWLLRKK